MWAGPALAIGETRTGSSSARRRASISGNSGILDPAVGEPFRPDVFLVAHDVELFEPVGAAHVAAEDPGAGLREIRSPVDRVVVECVGLVFEEAFGIQAELAGFDVQEYQKYDHIPP